jgi:hypothetical protein
LLWVPKCSLLLLRLQLTWHLDLFDARPYGLGSSNIRRCLHSLLFERLLCPCASMFRPQRGGVDPALSNESRSHMIRGLNSVRHAEAASLYKLQYLVAETVALGRLSSILGYTYRLLSVSCSLAQPFRVLRSRSRSAGLCIASLRRG